VAAQDTSATQTLSTDDADAVSEWTGPHLFLCLDAARPATTPSARWSLRAIERVFVGRSSSSEQALATQSGERTLRIFARDRAMSSKHAALTCNDGRWSIDDVGSRNGVRINGNLVERAILAEGDVIELGNTFFVFRCSVPEDARCPHVLCERVPPTVGLRTLSPALAKLFVKLTRIAESSVPILVSGETGTGKEVIASAVHDSSKRSGPLVAVNCGAIPAGLSESEFFGHERGAFTGAVASRTGRVLAANGGTLFLDEIGEMSESAQVALLRVLEEGMVSPLGSTRAALPVDLRVVAATNRDLRQRASQGAFRRDLYARLAGFVVELPPLRERVEDFGLIVAPLLHQLATEHAAGVVFESKVARALLCHDWPLNIRELRRSLEVALALAGEPCIQLGDLPVFTSARSGTTSVQAPEYRSASTATELHKTELERLLQSHRGNVNAIARSVGKDPKQVRRWLQKHDLDPAAYRKA
jgi:transcriptional regulator of acetoin/glycerol metabolism